MIEDPCPTCRGSGVEKRAREVQARIPAGVSDGQTIRLKGRGAPGRNGGPAGDLLVQIHVAPHPRFGRNGNDLTVRVAGQLRRRRARRRRRRARRSTARRSRCASSPAPSRAAATACKGKGIETKKGTGDLIVTVDVVVPTSLSEAERSAIEQLAAASAGAVGAREPTS